MSEIDEQMADDRGRTRDQKRRELIKALTDEERARLLDYLSSRRAPRFDEADMDPEVYLNGRASHLVDAFFWDREADSSGIRYDAWGRRVPAGGYV